MGFSSAGVLEISWWACLAVASELDFRHEFPNAIPHCDSLVGLPTGISHWWCAWDLLVGFPTVVAELDFRHEFPNRIPNGIP